MSVIDEPTDQPDDVCPACGGDGQVFLDGEPYFCLPCKGTGQIADDDECTPKS